MQDDQYKTGQLSSMVTAREFKALGAWREKNAIFEKGHVTEGL